ncbi:conserved hypothetical protein [Talaromyces stipitatus ATCC 10500]|uniref:Uncharacterized protein n=1 Tax=Talaromyces stipitatus (strain ATCC 10500 / CBS 375.48 / QM 6759 / NRRL 1006) TaxID=441959 RepID=B8MLE3_TALSN|nr:uncharacterized protein TSTA_045210 [Talaromyces stipitatus ATCC 10500]EED15058.1 conserved hypothetical protein [Talaromyces stipitatus ATCC 10500]
MRITSTLLALATVTTASPITKRTTSNTATDIWPVSNFTVGCSPAACVYKFAVTRVAGPNNPGFNTTCTGNDFTSDWHPCADSSVSAKIVPKTYPEWEVDVCHKYDTADKMGWIEAFANATVEDGVEGVE